MKYTYLLGGIHIASDIFFPELLQVDAQADVTMKYGEVPEHLEQNVVQFPFIEANETQYLLKLEQVGRILVENGTSITFQKEEKAIAHDLEKYAFSTAFGALSYQRNCIPMHGGVFVHEGKGILISGVSGNGKSTLLAALYAKGYQLLSDDISNLEIIDGKLMAHPSFPGILLWKDTAKELKIDLSAVPKLRSDMEKYILPIHNQFVSTPVEIEKIIILQNTEVVEQTIELKGIGKIDSLRRNTFKPWMIQAFGTHKSHFLALSKIANLVQLEVFQNNQKEGIEKSVNLFIEKLTKDAK